MKRKRAKNKKAKHLNYKEISMKKISQYILYAWSAIMLLNGLNYWVSTMGVVQGSEFGMQITMVRCMGMVMVWLAIFGVWFTLPSPKVKPSQ